MSKTLLHHYANETGLEVQYSYGGVYFIGHLDEFDVTHYDSIAEPELRQRWHDKWWLLTAPYAYHNPFTTQWRQTQYDSDADHERFIGWLLRTKFPAG